MSPISAQVFDEGKPVIKQICREMSREECIWLAAAIDFDGCISVSAEGPWQTVGLFVTNTSDKLLSKVEELTAVGSRAGVADGWNWGITKREFVHSILTQIEPYLIEKRELAAAVIAYMEIRLRTIEKAGRTNVGYTKEENKRWKKVLSLRRGV